MLVRKRIRLLFPALLLLLAGVATGCATDPAASREDCRQICAERARGCFQDACGMVDDLDSLCARRCRERQARCEADCAKPPD